MLKFSMRRCTFLPATARVGQLPAALAPCRAQRRLAARSLAQAGARNSTRSQKSSPKPGPKPAYKKQSQQQGSRAEINGRQAQRRKQAGVASKRASGFAQQRLGRLQCSGEELQEQLEALTPYIDLVKEGADREIEGSPAPSTGRGRGAKKAAVKTLLEAHTAVFSMALDLELQEEWGESEERLRSWSRQHLEGEGLAVFDLHASLDTTMFRDTIIRMYVPARPLPYHQLQQGDIILLSRGTSSGTSPIDSDTAVEGVLLDYSSRWMRVAAPAQQADAVRGPGWRIDLYANTVAYERSTSALQRFATGPAAAEGGESIDASSSVYDVWRLLTGVLPENSTAAVLASITPSWARGKHGAERLRAAKRAANLLASGIVSSPAPANTTTGSPFNAQPAAALQDSPAGTGTENSDGCMNGRHSNQGSDQGSNAGAAVRDGGLNASQAAAVQAALSNSVTLWQGPPGTGKTRTLIRFIKAVLAGLPERKQVLATAASNVAVDNMVQGLLQLGVDVVRIGQPAKVSAALRAVTLEARMANTPPGQQAAALRTKATKLSGGEAFELIQQAMELEETAAQLVLSGCQVVAATCIAAGDPRLALQGRTFPVMVLDEATQAPEPASLVPFMAAKAESLLLVGDPQQLPPTVKSKHAEKLGLGVSLFMRLQAQGLQPLLLDTQYRMHPDICSFPSAAFYQNRLMSHPTPEDRPAPTGFAWPAPNVPVCFIPIRGGGEQRTNSVEDASGSGFSLFNDKEAQQVLAVVQQLLAGGSLANGVADVGIVTPYNGQVRHLQRLVQSSSSHLPHNSSTASRQLPGAAAAASEATRPLSSLNARAKVAEGKQSGLFRSVAGRAAGGRNSRSSGSDDAEDLWEGGGSLTRQLEIKSVDGFQGREKEVIVFSAVRSNPHGAVGFLSDFRRLNVAITRAKRGLIVIGDPDTLRHDAIWNAWLNWSQRRNLWLQQPSPSNAATSPPAARAAAVRRQLPGGQTHRPVKSTMPAVQASKRHKTGHVSFPAT